MRQPAIEWAGAIIRKYSLGLNQRRYSGYVPEFALLLRRLGPLIVGQRRRRVGHVELNRRFGRVFVIQVILVIVAGEELRSVYDYFIFKRQQKLLAAHILVIVIQRVAGLLHRKGGGQIHGFQADAQHLLGLLVHINQAFVGRNGIFLVGCDVPLRTLLRHVVGKHVRVPPAQQAPVVPLEMRLRGRLENFPQHSAKIACRAAPAYFVVVHLRGRVIDQDQFVIFLLIVVTQPHGQGICQLPGRIVAAPAAVLSAGIGRYVTAHHQRANVIRQSLAVIERVLSHLADNLRL